MNNPYLNRRTLLSKIGTGMGTLGLAGLLHDEGLLARELIGAGR